MTDLDPITITLKVDTKDADKAFVDLGNQIGETSKTIEAIAGENPFLKFLGKKGELSEGEGLFANLGNKAADPTQSLSEGEKDSLNSIKGIEDILRAKLEESLEALRTHLESQNKTQEEIDAQVNFVRTLGEKRIDDLIEDFTDTLDEAVKDLSKKVADAFVDMALKGEFSIKKIGDIFLKTFLDIIAKELIQDPLEELLGTAIDAGTKVIFGSASGGEISAGVPTFINEQGQEVFIPHAPGKIFNSDQTRHMLGKSQGVVITQNLSFDTAIKNDMIGTILQASPLLVEQTKIAVLESLRGRRI